MSSDTLNGPSPIRAFEIAPELLDSPSAKMPDDKAPIRCHSEGCTNEVVKPARGRTPKYCPEHTASKPQRSTGWKNSAEIESVLSNYVRGLGSGLKIINQVDGAVIVDSGPAVVHELVVLARTNMKLRKYLLWLSAPGKYAPLVIASAAVIIPIAANHNLLPTFFIDLSDNDVTVKSEGGE